jgi:hypothetical protein
VLIWHLRGYPNATRRLDELGALTLSAVTYLEVLQGIRNKAELATGCRWETPSSPPPPSSISCPCSLRTSNTSAPSMD